MTVPPPVPKKKGQRVKSPRGREYELLELLGHGASSTVWLVLDIFSGQEWALKIVSGVDPKQLEREALLHGSLRHPNIVRMEQAWQEQGQGYFLQEWAAGGELFERIQPDRGFPWEAAHLHFTQLLAALLHIHDKGVAHRDVKAENLLLDVRGNLKLTDFGLATLYRKGGIERPLHSRCGTELYMAPEVFAGKPYAGEAADVWSLGMVLFLLVAGAYPWEGEASPRDRLYREYGRTREGLLSKAGPSAAPWRMIPDPIARLLAWILDPEASTRPTLKDIQAHSLIAPPNPMLEKGLVCKPEQLAALLNPPFVITVPTLATEEYDEDLFAPLTQPELTSISTENTAGVHRVPRYFSQPDLKPSSSSAPTGETDWLANRLTRFECQRSRALIVEVLSVALTGAMVTQRLEDNSVSQRGGRD